MNKTAKTVAGASGASILLLLFHFFHLFNLGLKVTEKSDPAFENAKATIILTDSAGNKDTIPLQDYIENMRKDTIPLQDYIDKMRKDHK